MAVALQSAPAHVRVIRPEFRGGSLQLFKRRDEELVIAGAAGTGKTIGVCNLLHAIALKYPGCRILMCRKTLTALATGAIVSYERHVLDPADRVSFFGGSSREPASYRYPNGSRIVIGGLDKASKVLSSEYDIIYVNEATEISLEDWELLSTRLRNGVVPYQQLLGDCNPDAPTHWIKIREQEKKLTLLASVHEDNPAYWNATTGEWTETGGRYISRLERLTGVRYLRYRKGIWAAAEGIVYENFNRATHIRERETPLPLEWARVWSVDFGFRDPFVWQCWAIDKDSRMWLEYEIYRTGRLVEDHAKDILRITGWQWVNGRMQQARKDPSPLPQAIVCDHDAEDRATLERHLHAPTLAAYKAISPGIQAVQARLRVEANGWPGLMLLESALDEPDQDLLDAKQPVRTADEFESYIWDKSGGKRKGEQPLDKYNHGMDALRYAVAWADNLANLKKRKWGAA